MNYLSLVEDGVEALREILRLYNFTGSAYAEKQIQGLAAASSKRHFARIVSENGVAFARGTLVDLTFDEDSFRRRGCFSVRGGARVFPGTVRQHEQLQPTGGAVPAEKGGYPAMAATRRAEGADVREGLAQNRER